MTGRGRNPYRPGVGLVPTYLAGRESEMRRFVATLNSAPEIPANIRLTGLRGVGKTVLLTKLRELADDNEWATLVIELEPRHNNNAGITRTLSSRCESLQERLSTAAKVRNTMGRTVEVARRAVTVRLEGMELSASGDLTGSALSLWTQLRSTAELARQAGRAGLVILIDEAQMLRDDKGRSGEHPLSLLIATVSSLQKQQVPVALVLCGLPTLAVNLLNARTYSERMFRGEDISSLPDHEARAAFTEPLRGTSVVASPDLVDAVLDAVDGYPYFIQLWGAELWDAASFADTDELSLTLLEATEPEIYRRLDFDFYEPRVQSLTPAEQDLLTDSSRCPYPPLVVADLTKRSPKSEGNVNVLLGRLVQANVLFRPRKGQYLYTAPGFHDYLTRRTARP